MDKVPEHLVGIFYYPCGSLLAYYLHSNELPFRTGGLLAISQVVACLGAISAGCVLSAQKRFHKRSHFPHFYLLGLGSALLTLGGSLMAFRVGGFLVHTILCGLGSGIVYISGISYVHFRSSSPKYRPLRIGVCHLFFVVGQVAAVHHINDLANMDRMELIIGYHIMISAALGLGVFLVNEILHLVGVYNYKQCRDLDLNRANSNGDRFQETLMQPVNVPDISVPLGPNERQQNALAAVSAVSKIVIGYLYNHIFVVVTLSSNIIMVLSYTDMIYLRFYMILFGLLVALYFALTQELTVIYCGGLLLMIPFSLIATSLFEFATSSFGYQVAAVIFLLFYVAGGLVHFAPDCMIMQFASLVDYEHFLAFGFVCEQLPLMVTVNVVNSGADVVYESAGLWTVTVSLLVGGAVLLFFVGTKFPDTFKKSLIEIQHLILFGERETLFSRNEDSAVLSNAFPTPIVESTSHTTTEV